MIKKIIKKILPPIIFDIFSYIYKLIKKENGLSSVEGNKTIDSDSIILRRKVFGALNPDKEFYVITGFPAGMFSTLQYVLAHIRRAEMFGMIPVVDFENFKTAYTSFPVNKDKNIWNWFFKSVSPYSLEEVYSSKNVFFGSGEYNWNMGHYFSAHNFFDIYSKHIVLQDKILKLINEYKIALHFSKDQKILGIQFRGWEQNTTARHPFCPTVKQMFACTDEIMKKYNIDRIYLATEQQEYHDAYIKRYGEKVVFTPYFMTKKGVNAYKIKPEPRPNHLYLCGVEVIINAFLLSECTGLLHCGTNVSTFAKFINNGKYEFEYFIFNGVNSSSPFLAKYMYRIKKILPKTLGGLKGEIRIMEKENSNL